jgi:ABC-2 type transport system permease protein
MIVMHVGLMSLICLGLAGISVGLGARFPNLRESDPSKIAAGFGGTLNLLLSLVFILLIVLTVGLPTHLAVSTTETILSTTMLLQDARLSWTLGLALIACLIVGLLAVILPMRAGLKAFRDAEL